MEDEELERIKQRKLRELMDSQREAAELSQVRVIELDASNFDDAVRANRLVLVDFWAEWCGPCRTMHPVFDRMARKYREVRFARLNVDRAQPIASRFGVRAIPTFIIFRDGQAVDRMMGAVGEPGIHMIIQKHLPAD